MRNPKTAGFPIMFDLILENVEARSLRDGKLSEEDRVLLIFMKIASVAYNKLVDLEDEEGVDDVIKEINEMGLEIGAKKEGKRESS